MTLAAAKILDNIACPTQICSANHCESAHPTYIVFPAPISALTNVGRPSFALVRLFRDRGIHLLPQNSQCLSRL